MTQYADIALRLPSTTERWAGERFRAELTSWVSAAVGEPTSLEQVTLRPWATVWRVKTPTGRFYAKQNCSTQAHEAALVLALNDLAARHVVPLTAVDTTRGLFLTPDLGTPLGDSDDIAVWSRVVAAGAHLQLEVARYAERLVGAGLPVLAPADCPAYVEQQLDSFAALPPGDPRSLPADRRAAVRAVLPQVAAWADRVAALRLPLTLCHSDLHGHHVFEVGEELRFFGFADAMVTEPLAALLVPLRRLAQRLRLPPEDPRLARVANAALEVWSEYAPMTELRAALPAALQLARLARVESWVRSTAAMNDEELAEWGPAAAAWLGSLTDPPPYRP